MWIALQCLFERSPAEVAASFHFNIHQIVQASREARGAGKNDWYDCNFIVVCPPKASNEGGGRLKQHSRLLVLRLNLC
jgi:hypothetical protein